MPGKQMSSQAGTIETHDLATFEQRHLLVEKSVFPDQVGMWEYNRSKDGLPNIEQDPFIFLWFQ